MLLVECKLQPASDNHPPLPVNNVSDQNICVLCAPHNYSLLARTRGGVRGRPPVLRSHRGLWWPPLPYPRRARGLVASSPGDLWPLLSTCVTSILLRYSATRGRCWRREYHRLSLVHLFSRKLREWIRYGGQINWNMNEENSTYFQATERIYRGVVAKPHSWPWIAKLKVTLKMMFIFLVVISVFCAHGGIRFGLLYMHDDLAMQFHWINEYDIFNQSHFLTYQELLRENHSFCFLLIIAVAFPNYSQFGETHFSHSLSALSSLNMQSFLFSLFINRFWKEKVLKSYLTFLCRCRWCQM